MAIVLALASFGAFVAFIGDIVVALQASTVIQRTAVGGKGTIAGRHPEGIGAAPDDPGTAERRVGERMSSGRRWALCTERAGYLTRVDGALIERAAKLDVLVVEAVAVGDFLVTGQRIGEVWGHADERPDLDGLRDAYVLGEERTLASDVAFPVRQLADIALKALSPGINDPTTAENAMGSLADLLVCLAAEEPVSAIRVDGEGEPRLRAEAATLDSLAFLGFEQVRLAAREKPVVLGRLRVLLGEIARAAGDAGVRCDEAARQRALLEAEEVPS